MSFWNLIVATVAIFVAIIFGQVEAGLANPYGASRDILNMCTAPSAGPSPVYWPCSRAGATSPGRRTRRFCPRAFWLLDVVLAGLVVTQVYLGDKLVWVYGLHTVPVVEAIRQGVVS